MATKKQIINVLRKNLDADLVDGLDTIQATHRVLGFVASKHFRKRDHAERQKMLWDALSEGLCADEQHNIGPIITMTPDEAELHAVE